jgi:hypothetical protein
MPSWLEWSLIILALGGGGGLLVSGLFALSNRPGYDGDTEHLDAPQRHNPSN